MGGFGFALLLNLPSSRYTEAPEIEMAAAPPMQSARVWQPMQPPKASQMQFLTRANSNNNNEMKMKEKVEGAMLKAIPVAGLLAPSAAHAYPRTQSLDYLINSLHFGGLLVIVIAAALIAVADLDPVSRG